MVDLYGKCRKKHIYIYIHGSYGNKTVNDWFVRNNTARICMLEVWLLHGLTMFDTHRDSSRVAVFFQRKTRWWFQIFFIFTPTWGRFPFWLIFLKWVETTTRLVYSRLAWKIGWYTYSSIVQNPVWTSWQAEKSLQVMMWSQWVVPIKVPRHG